MTALSITTAVAAAMAEPTPAARAGDVPHRVVSLAPSITEIVFALGAGDRLVGVSSYCDYPQEARSIDRVGTFLRPNVEVILAKRPDLVLAVPSPENRSSVLKLRDLGVRVRVVRPERFSEVLEAIDVIGGDLGLTGEADRLVESIKSEIAAIEARLEGVKRRRVLMIVGRRPLIAAGSGTYQDELIRMAGGINIAAAGGEAWPHLSLEVVIAAAPEVIIDTGMEASEAKESLEFWAPYRSIPAVRNGRVVGAGSYELLRPGPRAARTLEVVAELVHPEIAGGDRAPRAESAR
jgi:iron complex transport system substrate-binding protein